MSFDWTEERVEYLRRRRVEGAAPATIAAELGCSRSGVLGKAHRLDLPRHAAGKKLEPKPAAIRHKLSGARHASRCPDVVLLDEVVGMVPERGVPLWDLRLRHCRWVEASGPPWVFCGAPRARGSYCEEHARRVFYGSNREGK